MMTVSKLASLCGLSRTTVLYYESQGLLKPAVRSDSNYRVYGEKEARTLRQIRVYRSVGMSVRDIRRILAGPENDVASALKRRLEEVAEEIEVLRGHQKAILKLLQNKSIRKDTRKMTKDKWVAVMKAAGFSEERSPGVSTVPAYTGEGSCGNKGMEQEGVSRREVRGAGY